jgi:hypothetical protein
MKSVMNPFTLSSKQSFLRPSYNHPTGVFPSRSCVMRATLP